MQLIKSFWMYKIEIKPKPLLIAILCAAIFSAYILTFFIYATNAPRWDDYYDALYFLYLFDHASGFEDKFGAFLWRYYEQKTLYARLIYLAYYWLNQRLDFFYLSLIGMLQLLPTVGLLWAILQPQNNKTTKSAPIDFTLLIPFSLLFSFVHWRSPYWAMASISTLAAIFLAVTVVWFLRRATLLYLFLAMISMLALVYSQGNGIILLPLATLQIILSGDTPARLKRIWLLFAVSLLLLFVSTYEFYIPFVGISREEISAKIIDSVPQIITGFVVLVGSTPFTELDSVMFGALLGANILVLLCWVLAWMWKNDRGRFYPVAALVFYSLASLLVCSIGRVPFNGLVTAYESRYKIYSLVLLSIVLIFIYQQAKCNLLRWFVCCVVAALFINSYLRFLPQIVADSNNRRQEVTEWALKGTHESLGESGWVPLTEQVLFMSAREKFYSPFDSSRGALYQHQEPIIIDTCQITDSSVDISTATLENRKGALAAGIALASTNNKIKEILLCGEKSQYRLLPQEVWERRVVIDKTKLQRDTYAIYISGNDGSMSRLVNQLRITEEAFGLPCEEDWGAVQALVRAQIAENLCRPE